MSKDRRFKSFLKKVYDKSIYFVLSAFLIAGLFHITYQTSFLSFIFFIMPIFFFYNNANNQNKPFLKKERIKYIILTIILIIIMGFSLFVIYSYLEAIISNFNFLDFVISLFQILIFILSLYIFSKRIPMKVMIRNLVKLSYSFTMLIIGSFLYLYMNAVQCRFLTDSNSLNCFYSKKLYNYFALLCVPSTNILLIISVIYIIFSLYKFDADYYNHEVSKSCNFRFILAETVIFLIPLIIYILFNISINISV